MPYISYTYYHFVLCTPIHHTLYTYTLIYIYYYVLFYTIIHTNAIIPLSYTLILYSYTGEIPGLFAKDEIMAITADLRNSFVKERIGLDDTQDNLKQYFIDKVRDNLHLILCMSPMNAKFPVRYTIVYMCNVYSIV